jgi:hypothetical protein
LNKKKKTKLLIRKFFILDVATSTYFNNDQSKLEFCKQILLRFTTIGDATNNGTYALDKLPPNLHVIINNRVVTLPQPKPTAKPTSDVIRPGLINKFLEFFSKHCL